MINEIPTKELSEFLGVTPGFVSHVKTNRRKLPVKHCLRVWKKYGIPLNTLRPDIYPAG